MGEKQLKAILQIITSSDEGAVTIPDNWAKELGWKAGDLVKLKREGTSLHLIKDY